MNNFDELIRTHIYNLSTAYITDTKIVFVLIGLLCFLGVVFLVLGFRIRDFRLVIIAIPMLILFPICEINIWNKISFNVNTVDIKQEYNITLEEKDKTIELLYNENKESSKYIKEEYIKDKFKIVFSKDKEEHYYVYFDDKIKDITIEEIKQFFKDNVDYAYYESLEKFRLEDLTQKDNKSSKEANIEDLEKKLNESKNNTEQLQKELDELKKERN